jgi:endonuclease/exonuclease/phosphatase family metal-dependent hydrolase
MWTSLKSPRSVSLPTALATAVAALATASVVLSPVTASAHPSSPDRHAHAGASRAAGQSRLTVSVMTYNLLEISADGKWKGGNQVASWPQRRTAQIQLIDRASPDVISVQEGGSWVGRVRGPRQVDDLRAHLGGVYGLAHTEVPPSHKHYFRTGCYILYKRAEYKAVGHSGHWALGNRRWAAYQVLKSRATGAKFLMVDPHLIVRSAGGTDAMRRQETATLVAKSRNFDAKRGNLPIVYAGDFNSDNNSKHTVNAPSDYLQAHGFHDSFRSAHSRSNARYNSANGYHRRPPAKRDRLDYIFTSRHVQVPSWHMLLNLRHGRFAGVIPSDHNPIVATLRIPY